ncbi:MAG TPA: sugar phosphate isomerase/epimerase [Candidatus Latescibacteria bacterium]|jgi:sugar phosphate isomerase/epimerase|nr:sugar phosphate isomerase/epimerase [Candidatus Latescibacterota bacterium]HJP29383.1 sugar phosphate isomerase/epimerase [Candidatus Latescibacterota bacterium]|tara:strand:- start:425 stop:1300 length:876 start_codon:yes stop_codon:yes gene_type:complete
MKLAITSVMLPRWDLSQTFDKLAAYGYEGLELRVRDNPEDAGAEPSFWGRHLADVSPTNILDRAAEIRAEVERSGIPVIALAPRASLGDDGLIDLLFEGAKAIDADNPPMIRIGAPRHDRTEPYMPQFDAARAGFEKVVDRALSAGVKALYEIHVGTVAVSCSRTAELMRGLDADHIGAIYDVPNMIRVGIEDTRMGLELLGPYLAHCHIGNGIPVADKQDLDGPTDRQDFSWAFADLRRGVADIPQIIQDLKDVGYSGYVSLEEFGTGDDDEKVAGQGAYLRHLMEAPGA